MNIRPILAAPLLPPTVEHTDNDIIHAMQRLRYPVLATLKKDGVRAMRLNGSLLSRTLKPIPNKALRDEAALILAGGMDMELWSKDLDYCDIESIVMSHSHVDTHKIQFHLLDWLNAAPSYIERCDKIASFMKSLVPVLHERIKFAPPVYCYSAQQLFSFFRVVEDECGEGICFRTPTSPYKYGRSTLKEQHLVKLCRMTTAEAEIIGFKEQYENGNTAKRNGVGMMDRSSAQSRMYGKNTLGAFHVRDLTTKLEFDIGTGVGLTDVVRQKIWDNRDCYFGRVITYKCKTHGEKTLPRSPVWKGFRDKEIDI